MTYRSSMWLVAGLLVAAATAGAQGNEFYLNIKADVVDKSIDATSEGSAISITKAVSDKGYRLIDPGLRAALDKVCRERLTVEMLQSGDVMGQLGLDVPQGAKYIILGVSRIHFEGNVGPFFVYNATITVRVLDVESQRVVMAEDVEGKGNAASRRQAALDADKDAGAKIAAQLNNVLAAPASGDWFKIHLTYGNRREGLEAFQKIKGWPAIKETKRVSTDETLMIIEARSELSMSDFQDEFEMFVMDAFPKAKLDFARSIFNVNLGGGAMGGSSGSTECEEADEGTTREPPTQVEATGFGVIENGDVDKAKKEALFMAFRAAVEQGVHVYIDSSTIVENFETIEDKIYTQASGFVESHQILQEGQNDPTTYFVRIRATVKFGKLKESLGDLMALQERTGRMKAAIVCDWVQYDGNPRAPAGPVTEARVMRAADQPATGALRSVERFLHSKKFHVHDQAAMAGFNQRLLAAGAVGGDESQVIDLLTKENLPADLVMFVTVWSEGVTPAGDKTIARLNVQVKAYHVSLQKSLGVKAKRANVTVAGNNANPVFEMTAMAEKTACELTREFWSEMRAALC